MADKKALFDDTDDQLLEADENKNGKAPKPIPTLAKVDEHKTKKKKHKRDRLKRGSSLDKVDEETIEKETKGTRNPFGCHDFSFGVRSYLHNFYDPKVYKDPDVYEEDDYRYLLSGPYPRRRRCTSIWWKVFVWIGANLLVFGILGVLIGYLVPQKSVIIGSLSENQSVIDHEAIAYNFNLDVCKLVGLVLFCMGGLTLTLALLSPSFMYSYFDDDRYPPEAFKVKVCPEYTDEPPLSPTEKNIPASSLVKNVQPDRKSEESIVTKEGMMPYHD